MKNSNCMANLLGDKSRAKALCCFPVALGCIVGTVVLFLKSIVDIIMAVIGGHLSSDPAAAVSLGFGLLEVVMGIACVLAYRLPKQPHLNSMARICFIAVMISALTTIIVQCVVYAVYTEHQGAASAVILAFMLGFNLFILMTAYEYASSYAALAMVVKAGGDGWEGRSYTNVHMIKNVSMAKSHFVDDGSSI
ncbi:MAG: hypothetical protein KVP17_000614 [Porospora cf. gigantea B]|uniref:uncharacterized protein n=1 Tax=Porospora cf. gigantea B TaxID=2853592 RepID=UPI003571DEBC|nr:MAG: hypothetical protein KVP17_000614 [Porospora cf. gigantea B]